MPCTILSLGCAPGEQVSGLSGGTPPTGNAYSDVRLHEGRHRTGTCCRTARSMSTTPRSTPLSQLRPVCWGTRRSGKDRMQAKAGPGGRPSPTGTTSPCPPTAGFPRGQEGLPQQSMDLLGTRIFASLVALRLRVFIAASRPASLPSLVLPVALLVLLVC